MTDRNEPRQTVDLIVKRLPFDTYRKIKQEASGRGLRPWELAHQILSGWINMELKDRREVIRHAE